MGGQAVVVLKPAFPHAAAGAGVLGLEVLGTTSGGRGSDWVTVLRMRMGKRKQQAGCGWWARQWRQAGGEQCGRASVEGCSPLPPWLQRPSAFCGVIRVYGGNSSGGVRRKSMGGARAVWTDRPVSGVGGVRQPAGQSAGQGHGNRLGVGGPPPGSRPCLWRWPLVHPNDQHHHAGQAGKQAGGGGQRSADQPPLMMMKDSHEAGRLREARTVA